MLKDTNSVALSDIIRESRTIDQYDYMMDFGELSVKYEYQIN